MNGSKVDMLVTCAHQNRSAAEPVLIQDDADAIAANLDLSRAAYLVVHRVAGYRGTQLLIQPVWAIDWEH